jgi:hypothetical protein
MFSSPTRRWSSARCIICVGDGAPRRSASGGVDSVSKVLDRLQTRRADRGHVPQPKDHDGLHLVQVGELRRELVGGTEQKRALNPDNRRVVGQLAVL